MDRKVTVQAHTAVKILHSQLSTNYWILTAVWELKGTLLVNTLK